MSASEVSPRRVFTHSLGLSTDPVPLDPYRSADYFARERERVFRRAWLLLGRVEEVPNVGDFAVKTVDPDSVSVLCTHGKDGAIRTFYNSCSHRGSQVVSQPRGSATRFACPYHKWTYSNDGALIAIPDESSFFKLEKKRCGLSQIATSVWEGWIFVNLSPEPEIPLREFLGGFADYLKGLHYLAAPSPIVVTAILEANWKVVSDAFIESYHIPAIHPNTIATTFSSAENPFAHLLDAETYGPHRRVSMYGNPEYATGEMRRVEKLAFSAMATGSVIAAAGTTDAERFLAHRAVNPTRSKAWSMDVNHVFPNTHIDCGPGGFWTHQFWPLTENRTRYEVRFYVPHATSVRERFQQELFICRVIEIVLEDLVNVARTQRGIDSGGKTVMQLQDNEVGIRHSLEQVEKWVNSASVAQALA
jgi:phenylpropionate dioxygenase-like ring-hydroxylating dioxygenase large terminal subunit